MASVPVFAFYNQDWEYVATAGVEALTERWRRHNIGSPNGMKRLRLQWQKLYWCWTTRPGDVGA